MNIDRNGKKTLFGFFDSQQSFAHCAEEKWTIFLRKKLLQLKNIDSNTGAKDKAGSFGDTRV